MNPSDYLLKEIAQISKNHHEKEYEWLRGIVLAASSLLGVLVALKGGQSTTLVEHRVFLSAIALLGLGILFGSIALYGEVALLQRLRISMADHYKEVAMGAAMKQTFYSEAPKVYVICKRLCFTALMLSMMALVWYAGLADLHTPDGLFLK